MNGKTHEDYKSAITASGKSIYDEVSVDDQRLWIPTDQLQILISSQLAGMSLAGLPIRSRSKVVKTAVCNALGYKVPPSFKKTRPRFPGQQLDVFTQKSLNLQIWNDEISPNRRYALVRVSEGDVVTKVVVKTGIEIARFDTTGTLTTKYQASLIPRIASDDALELISAQDTFAIRNLIQQDSSVSLANSPVDDPSASSLLSIRSIFNKLCPLVGCAFADPGSVQERNRGAALHKLVCQRLGYSRFEDNGQFPDIRHQLLEIKLQTSPTIDLGLVLPCSEEPLQIPPIGSHRVRHCDTRYAVFYGETDGSSVRIDSLHVTTGEDFFVRFRQFAGKVSNAKLQIPLPSTFFDR